MKCGDISTGPGCHKLPPTISAHVRQWGASTLTSAVESNQLPVNFVCERKKANPTNSPGNKYTSYLLEKLYTQYFTYLKNQNIHLGLSVIYKTKSTELTTITLKEINKSLLTVNEYTVQSLLLLSRIHSRKHKCTHTSGPLQGEKSFYEKFQLDVKHLFCTFQVLGRCQRFSLVGWDPKKDHRCVYDCLRLKSTMCF